MYHYHEVDYLPPPPKKPEKLKVGKTYEFRRLNIKGKPLKLNSRMANIHELRFIASVAKEYEKFWLLDHGGYTSALHKYAIGIDYRAGEI